MPYGTENNKNIIPSVLLGSGKLVFIGDQDEGRESSSKKNLNPLTTFDLNGRYVILGTTIGLVFLRIFTLCA